MTEQLETSGSWTPPPAERYVSVWPHTLGDFEKYPGAVATVDAGVLYVWRSIQHGQNAAGPDKSQPPLKVYAPGYWATFEHVGNYAAPPVFLAPADRHPVETGLPVLGILDESIAREKQLIDQGPPTSEIPTYRDPIEKLAPELLDEENGDVSHRSGVGVLVPKLGKSDPDAPRCEVVIDPKVEGDGAESPDTDMSVARYVFGDSWDRPRRWLRERRWQPSRGGRTEPTLNRTPTHLLSLAIPRSRTAYWFLAGLLPLSILILTTR